MVDGLPRLVNPSACIGHGACLKACGMGAIRLVLGHNEHGVAVPELTSGFATNVPRMFVAGEIAGVGLIHDAVKQGVAAVEAILQERKLGVPKANPPALDLIIIGAGPAGIAAALRARQAGLRFRVIERRAFGGTVATFPKQKLVMSAPMTLPLRGKLRQLTYTKEELLALWAELRATYQLPITECCEVTSIRHSPDDFTLTCGSESLVTRHLLIAIGRRGTPRRLGVPGEALPHVAYEFDDPALYAGRACAVFGGGDAAIETALSLAPMAPVTLIHRRTQFDSAKPANQAALAHARNLGQLEVITDATPLAIKATTVTVETVEQAPRDVPADRVFVMIGGEPPKAFLQMAGIHIRTVYGKIVEAAKP